MVQKVKEKKSELQCYINGPENLSGCKTYLMEAFIILLFSSKLYLGLPYINWLTSKPLFRCEISLIIFSTVSKRICWNLSKMAMQEKVNS